MRSYTQLTQCSIYTCNVLTTVVGKSHNITQTNAAVNNKIMEMIAEIETSNYNINTLIISYDDYKKRTDAFLSDYVPNFYRQNDIIYAEDNIVFAITGKDYKEDDWKGMPLEELKKIGELLMQSLPSSKKAYFYNSFDISKIYDDNSNSDTSTHFKHVYVRHIYNISDKKYIPYKKYIFKKEGNAYVLFSIYYIKFSKFVFTITL